MPTPAASIVIPTYNRLDTLPEVLTALANQQPNTPPFETIVVDDGSSDDTATYLQSIPPTDTPPHLTVLTQQNQGPAAARNAGVRAAGAPIVAFLGDDTVPSPGWLAAHLEARQRHVSAGADGELLAVLGYTGWHPRMRLNPFLRYVNDYGLQFGYAIIEDPDDVPFNFFYTSNLSLPRELLLAEPFDVEFPYPAWEDVEAGYRMSRRGMRLVYAPRASTAHDHPTTVERFAERQEKAGYSAVVFHRRHPELGPFLGLGPDGPPPLPPARRQRWLERMVCTLQSLPLKLPRWWEEVLRYHYIRGLRRGWREIEGAGPSDDRGWSPESTPEGERNEATAN